jgi:hypothetical protein
MAKCAAIARSGLPCRGLVRPGNDYCPAHDLVRQEARRRSASKAARSKPGREISDLKSQLETLAEAVLAATVEPKVGAVVTQILNAWLKLIELERRIKETDELEAKIEQIQEALEWSGGGSRGAA